MAYPNNMFNPMQQTQNQIMLVPVNGEGGAQMYPVAAGSTVALIDFDACIFWLKKYRRQNQSALPSSLRLPGTSD